ncbi:Hypothetical predicted protein [Mytilus galloprovincialis]|uniref:B box-type domain-containing protein n=1 Tax=Mytilus galloprovincialis TaxID=29158 RepID=A0A8B6GRQ3_MYTGA|nr:Hypothetical predicted protein [Mytilus galloprovincialis]
MASSKPVPCGPCREEKVNTKADIWCNNCDEGLCSTCLGHHKRIKSSRNHKTIDIRTYTSYKPTAGIIKTECGAHSQQFNLYCPSHLMPCCDECISTSHSKCNGIKSLASVVEKTKIEKFRESVEKDINSITYFLNKLVNSKSENIKRGKKQFETIKQSLSKIRNEINKQLDCLEKKLCKEADTVWRQEKSKLTSLITEIEDKTKQFMEMQDDLKTFTKHTSKLQCFLRLHQFEQQVSQCQRYIDNLEDSKRASEVDIKIKQNGELEKILKELQLINSLGEVMVVNTEISMKRQTSVSREAQIEQSNIENMTMNIETTIPINIRNQISCITDMICLMDGRFIVVEQMGKINLLKSDGKFEKQLPKSGKAWSVTQISQDNFALTYMNSIKIFNMKNETVTKVIKLKQNCFDLSFSNNSLALGLGMDEIRIIDLEGNTLKSIQVESKSSLCHLVYCNDRVFYSDCIYSDCRGNAVYCVEESGKQIWQYTQDLSAPQGLCVDTYGNIIVADFGSGSVKVISKDGKDSKELVREEDLGYRLGCICFNKHEESYGFICDANGKSITRFNLSYD